MRHVLKMNVLLILSWNKRKTSVNEPQIIVGKIFLNKVQFSRSLWCVLPYFAVFQATECIFNGIFLKEEMMSLLWQHKLESHTQENKHHNYTNLNLTTNRSKAHT